MIITREPNMYSFTGNTIVFEALVETSDQVAVEIIVNNKSNYTVHSPYKEGGQYKIKLDLADYLIAEKRDLYIPLDKTIAPLHGFALPYKIRIGSDYSFEGIAFKGGITKSNFKALADNGFDIFSYRLGSFFNQFLFTTRTHSNELKIRESELYPFVFINPGLDFVFKSELGDSISINPNTSEKICVLNIQAVRDNFQRLYGKKPNILDVKINSETAFRIIIEPKAISEENYLIQFLNSLGAYECIEVVGKLAHTPEFEEENKYAVFNKYNFFEDRRNRVLSRRTMKVETGYRHFQEFSFILDMVKSDEIYFRYPDGTSFRCNVTTEDLKFYDKVTTPTSIPLIISEISNEEYISNNLDRELLLSGSHIFDDTFDNTYE